MSLRVRLSILVGFVSFLFFVSFQVLGIYGGDSGDLVTAAVTFGVPHPPGYPLYTFLGWLASKLPLLTPAWRVGLLSSIPHAVTVALVFLIVATLTRRIVPALFATFALAGNYLFFLYSVTPEVFALFDFFVVLLLFLLMRLYQTKKIQYLYAASFVFGLSLSHHHVILFLVPAMAYGLWTHGKSQKYTVKSTQVKKNFVLCTVYFLLGLLPYLYIPIAARGSSIINWDRAVDLSGFIRLVTRADYGTFVSGGFYGSELAHRFISLKAYPQFLLLDFSWIGLILVLLGLVALIRFHRTLFWFLTLALLFLGPFFFFYASFPLINRFTVGTYERFLLPSYVIISILMGMGVSQAIEWLVRSPFAGGPLKKIAVIGFVGLLFLLPLSRAYSTVWRFWGLPADNTAQHLGIDMLTSLPDNSILFLTQDTPLFAAQYVRYALGIRKDIKAIHVHRLESDEYLVTLARVFPDLAMPKSDEPDVLTWLIRANGDRFPIFANRRLPAPLGWYWVPWGLAFQLVKEKDLPRLAALRQANDALWNNFHDPTKGILSRYNHLMLADVRDVYAASRIVYGKVLLRGNVLVAAREQFDEAVRLGGDTHLPDAYTYAGLTAMFEGKCEDALRAFANARKVSLSRDTTLTLYESALARDCQKNPGRAQELLEQYEKEKQATEIPLE